MASSYYNEIDPWCNKILSVHIENGTLPAGKLDTRSIIMAGPSDVVDYDECHFFAGIGGFPLGFKRAGLSGVNVWTGGFPCQDVSVAGNRAGLAGERSGLWFEFYRLLAASRPDWVVIENVPGLLSSNGGRDFATIVRGLVKLGYGVCWRILDAQYFGVPQRRRRVFIVGHLGDGRAAQVLFESEGGAWDPPPSREAGQKVAGTLAAGAHPGGFNGRDAEQGNLIAVARPLAYGSTIDHYDESQQTYIVANTLGAHHGRNDLDSMGAYVCMAFVNAGDGSSARAATNIVPPLTNRHGDPCSVTGAFGVRRLTPTECERLQGFPDGWTGEQSDTQRYKQLGNAVAVPCAEWIGRRIKRFSF